MRPAHEHRRLAPRPARTPIVPWLALALAVVAATGVSGCRSRDAQGAAASQSSMVPATLHGATAASAAGNTAPHITVRAFCDGLGAVFCTHCGAQTADCVASFMTGCLEGHDPAAMTTHTQADLDACAREMLTGNCERMAAGDVPPACQ